MIKFNEVNAIEKIADKRKNNNIILSKNVKVSLDKKISRGNNNHVLVIGGSGTGKTYSYVESNINEMNSNYIIMDNDSFLYNKYKDNFNNNGYKIFTLDLNNLNEIDIFINNIDFNNFTDDIKLVVFIKNTNTSYESSISNANLIKGLFNILYQSNIGRTHVILDEFYNISKIDNLSDYLNKFLYKNINVSILIQNITQLEFLYPEDFKSIVKGFDNILYFCDNNKRTKDFLLTLNNMDKDELKIELDKFNNDKCVICIKNHPIIIDDKFYLHKNPKALKKNI